MRLMALIVLVASTALAQEIVRVSGGVLVESRPATAKELADKARDDAAHASEKLKAEADRKAESDRLEKRLADIEKAVSELQKAKE